MQSRLNILDVYNYPNPAVDKTYFTFRLTQIPNYMKIKIYTIAGRLIKVINLLSSQLHYNFNKIYWNTTDEDGNLVANGVYLYKVIISKGNIEKDIMGKLAIVK